MIRPLQREPVAYHLLITLQGSKPSIWRRVLVPGAFSLKKLHKVIQAAMGWQECHLHEFIIGHEHFGEPHPDYEGKMLDHARYRLEQVAPRAGMGFLYVYDFGDGWQHRIEVERIFPAHGPLPICLRGQNACPPEDSGSLFGYYEKLKIRADRSHPDHRDIKQWMGDFKPKVFDPDEANRRLQKLRPRKA